MGRSLLDGFQSWWQAGEETALVVYAKNFRMTLLLQCCAFAAFCAIPSFRRYILVLLVLTVLTLSRTVAEGRRAIIFTESEVIYRPALARLRRVPFSSIRNLTRTNVTVFYLLRPSSRLGVTMTLTNGEEEVWPLDFNERDEVLRRLSAATGKTIEGRTVRPWYRVSE